MSPPEARLPRVAIFELERTLLDRRWAWQYALEQAIGTVCRRRADASDLVAEYHARPVGHALAVLLEDGENRVACERVWRDLYHRSALKRLLVHEGIAPALDRLMHAGVEIGVASREARTDARKALESTGLDRFVAVLSCSDDGQWAVGDRIAECLAYLERQPGQACFSSVDERDAEAAREAGLVAVPARWVEADPPLDARAIVDSVAQCWRAALRAG